VRTFFHFLSDTLCAVLYVASIAIAAGTVGTVYTHRLRDGMLVGLAALVCAAGGFGYSIWRTYWPRRATGLFRSRRIWRTTLSPRRPATEIRAVS
jgi:hypothetical protein